MVMMLNAIRRQFQPEGRRYTAWSTVSNFRMILENILMLLVLC